MPKTWGEFGALLGGMASASVGAVFGPWMAFAVGGIYIYILWEILNEYS